MNVVFESGNVYLEKQDVRMKIFLRHAGKVVRRYYEGKMAVNYELPLKKDTKADFSGLAEGNYELVATIEGDSGEILTIGKKIVLLGKELSNDRAACEIFQQRLNIYKKNKSISNEQKYDAIMTLEELKVAVEHQDVKTIHLKREKLEKILAGLPIKE